MSIPVFPVALEGRFLKEGYQEKGDSAALRSSMDTGPAKVRRRATAVVPSITASIFLKNSELSTFRTFYENTLYSGAYPFTTKHPKTGATTTFRFLTEYTIVPRDLGYVVSFEWEILP